MSTPTHTAYLAIGSNIEPADNIARALALLRGLPRTRLIAQSPHYRTRPWGLAEQDDFLNLVVALDTGLSAHDLLAATQAIERQLGRTRQVRNGPRTMDLDILLYGAQVIAEPDLSIPHPGLLERDFMLIPLLDIAPALRHPGTGEPLANARGTLRFHQIIVPLPPPGPQSPDSRSSG